MLNVITKSGPDPTKLKSWSGAPFVCPSLAERIFLVMLSVTLVSFVSSEELEQMPSNLSPDLVIIVAGVPYEGVSKTCICRPHRNLRWLTRERTADGRWRAYRVLRSLSAAMP